MKVIRALCGNDKALWLPLWNGYLAFYQATISSEITEQSWSRLCDPAEPLQGLAVFSEGQMIGIAHYIFHRSSWADTNYCYLEDLFVVPEARGKGAGRALIEAVRDKARTENACRLYWTTHKGNKSARALYDKLAVESGFVQYRMSL